jgi:hypothetical protein
MKHVIGLLLIACLAEAQPATGAYKLSSGSYQLTTSSGAEYAAGGVFDSNPGTARDATGNTFVVGRDASNGVWIRKFLSASSTFESSWVYIGAIVKGTVNIDVAPSGTAFVAARDLFNSYWINSYAGVATGWVALYGILSTDPVVAATDGDVYTVGLDNYGVAYSNRYQIATSQADWLQLGGVFAGKPSASIGSDGALYLAARDTYGSVWVGRQLQGNWSGWRLTGGVGISDPEIVPVGSSLYVVVQTSNGTPFYGSFPAGAFGASLSVNWNSTNQAFSSSAAGSNGSELYVAGTDASSKIWWFRPGQAWVNSNNTASGSVDVAEPPAQGQPISLIHTNPNTVDLPSASSGKGPPAAASNDCGDPNQTNTCMYSAIQYVSPNQVYGTSGTFTTGPLRFYYTNYASAIMTQNGQNLGSNCASDAISLGDSIAERRVPCDSQTSFLVSAANVYTAVGSHRAQAIGSDTGIRQTYDNLGFVAAGSTKDFPSLPLGAFTDYRFTTGPTISGNNGGITVQYFGTRAQTSASVRVTAPYSAIKGRHQIGFPGTDYLGLSKQNQWFAIVVYDATPVISSVSPTTISALTQTTLTVRGTGFGTNPTVYLGTGSQTCAGTAYNPGPPTIDPQGQDVVQITVNNLTIPLSAAGAPVRVCVRSNGAGGSPFFGAPQGAAGQGSPNSGVFQVQVQQPPPPSVTGALGIWILETVTCLTMDITIRLC